MSKTILVLQKDNQIIRFDIMGEEVVITQALKRKTLQAKTPFSTAKEFVSWLKRKGWVRNNDAAETLAIGKFINRPED